MEDLILVVPTLAHKLQAKEILEETKKCDANSKYLFSGFSSLDKYEIYEDWLQKLKEDAAINHIKPNRVPACTYFLMRKSNNHILGIINIRHALNDYLLAYGGHIGYSIRPSERQKGYGKKQLLLGLQKCKEIPLQKVLITCLEDNEASRKTIESCGGILENIQYDENSKNSYLRYWITL